MYRFRPFRLQFASNLFVHRGAPDPSTLLKPAAPNLALLGNIGSVSTPEARAATREFLQFCALRWKQTFWILGHTELSAVSPTLWRDLHEETKALAEEVSEYGSRVQVLDCDAESVHGVRLLGATGWNPVPTRLESPAETGMPPIWMWEGTANRPFKSIDSQLMFAEEADWLAYQFRNYQRPSILLTAALASPLLLNKGLPTLAYRLCDLTTFYPVSFLDGPLIACLGGSTGSVASGTWNERYHAVNSYRAYPGAPPNPNYSATAVFEFTGETRTPSSPGSPQFPLPLPVAPNALAIC